MDRLLSRLQRKIGWLAIPNLPAVLAGGMCNVFGLVFLKPEILPYLYLNWNAVQKGQVWRLVSYIFIPDVTPGGGSLNFFWFFMSVWFTWWAGTNLENGWGSFRFTLYVLVGMLGHTAAAWITGIAGPAILLYSSIFFAFATLYPDLEILVFFILPIRVKWLALVQAAYLIVMALLGGWELRAGLVAAFANYLLFFTGYWLDFWRGRAVMVRQGVRREALREETRRVQDAMGYRVCAICGAQEQAGADIRVCTCEKCGGVARTLCLEHARNH